MKTQKLRLNTNAATLLNVRRLAGDEEPGGDRLVLSAGCIVFSSYGDPEDDPAATDGRSQGCVAADPSARD